MRNYVCTNVCIMYVRLILFYFIFKWMYLLVYRRTHTPCTLHLLRCLFFSHYRFLFQNSQSLIGFSLINIYIILISSLRKYTAEAFLIFGKNRKLRRLLNNPMILLRG